MTYGTTPRATRIRFRKRSRRGLQEYKGNTRNSLDSRASLRDSMLGIKSEARHKLKGGNKLQQSDWVPIISSRKPRRGLQLTSFFEKPVDTE